MAMPKPALPPGTMLEKYRGEVPSWDSPDTDEIYEAFFEPVKPRDNPEFQQALAASTDKRFREYLRQLNLPKNRNKKCSTIAKVMDISLAEFVDFLRTSYRAQAMSVAAMRLPEITIHMANDALTQKEACGRCDGWGFVTVTAEELPPLEDGQPIPGGVRPMGARWVRDCPKCDATGKTSKPGDAHARTSILEMNGLGKKSGGVTVAINNNYNGHGIENASARFAGLSFDISSDSIESIGGDPVSGETQRDHASDDSDPVEANE